MFTPTCINYAKLKTELDWLKASKSKMASSRAEKAYFH